MEQHEQAADVTNIRDIFHAVAYNYSGAHRYTDRTTGTALYYSDKAYNTLAHCMAAELHGWTP